MVNIKIQLIAFLLICFGLTSLKAQEVILSTDGEAKGNGGSVSYSIGQVFYSINIGTNGTLSQGVQQPYEISVVTGLPESEGINLNLSVFPNPATDFLMLTIEGEMDYAFTALIFDNTGKSVAEEKVTGPETKIDMRSLKQATYFLKVIQDDKEVKIFKIVKI